MQGWTPWNVLPYLLNRCHGVYYYCNQNSCSIYSRTVSIQGTCLFARTNNVCRFGPSRNGTLLLGYHSKQHMPPLQLEAALTTVFCTRSLIASQHHMWEMAGATISFTWMVRRSSRVILIWESIQLNMLYIRIFWYDLLPLVALPLLTSLSMPVPQATVA